MSTSALDARTARPGATTLLVGLLAAAIFLGYVDRGLLAIAAPLIKTEMGLSATEFGLAVSAFFWIYTPGQLLCGWMVDRFSVYRLFAAGVLLSGVATLLIGIAAGLASLVLLRFLLGLGQSFSFPGSSKLIARHCRADQRGSANGLIMSGLAGGQAVGALAGGLIMATFGWHLAFALFGLITLIWLIPWQALDPASTQRVEDESRQASIPHREILSERALWGSCAAHFCNNYGFFFFITWLPLYLVSERGLSLEMMAMLTALIYATQTVIAFVSGWASDRLIAGGLGEGAVRKSIVVGANVVKAAAIVGIAFAEGLQAMFACALVTGITTGMTSPQNFAIPQVFAGPRAAGRWVGMQNFAASLSGLVGPIITGLIVDATGNYVAAFALAGAITLGAAFFWGVVVPRLEPVRWRSAV